MTKLSEVSDLEPRFGGNPWNADKEIGVPNHLLRFAARVFGMTRLNMLFVSGHSGTIKGFSTAYYNNGNSFSFTAISGAKPGDNTS
jgi:hypothetical protein